MEQFVTIKSYQHGFALYIKENASFEKVLEEIKQKFSGSRQFFGSAKVSFSLEGMELTPEQEFEIVDAIPEVQAPNTIYFVMSDVQVGSDK